MKISKEQEKIIIRKAIDYFQDHNILEAEARLYSFIFGFLADDTITYNEVYITVKRIMLTIIGTLEELEHEE